MNNHPQNYFDSKPFTNKGPLPPEKEKEAKRAPVKPFKHSSPAKHIGGCKAGCFDSYPLHSYDSYTVKTAKKVATNSSGKLFRAIPGPKSTPTTSILTKNVNTHVNKSNYRGRVRPISPKFRFRQTFFSLFIFGEIGILAKSEFRRNRIVFVTILN